MGNEESLINIQKNYTPYPDINEILDNFRKNIKACLETEFVGMYLYGSLALGDFNPQQSDIDFIVITTNEISNGHFQQLENLHKNFCKTNSFWKNKIEAVYLPKNILNNFSQSTKKYPQINAEGLLDWEPLEIDWPFQAYTLREYGITIEGQNLNNLLVQVDFQVLKNTSIKILQNWETEAKKHSVPNWLKSHKNYILTIQTLCRFIYLNQNRKYVSKLQSTDWCLQNIKNPWTKLISNSIARKSDDSMLTGNEIDNVINFIKYCLQLINS